MEPSNSGQNNSQQSGQQGNNAGNTTSSWFDSFEPELKSYVQKKGFENPQTLADSYRNLEKLSGGDRKNLVKFPDDISSDEMNPIWERLGRPKEGKEYLFDLPEETKPYISDEELNQTKEFFLKNNFTRKQAEGFMKMYLERLQGQIKTRTETLKSKQADDMRALEKDWGQAYKENQNTVANTVKKLGINETEWQVLQGSLGTKRANEILYTAGRGSKEADFVPGNNSTGSAYTPGDAKAEIKQLMADKDFARRLGSGDVEARKRWDKLHEAASPGEMTI